MHRFILPLALAAGLVLAGSASASVGVACANVTLDSNALQEGTQAVTLTGTGTCRGIGSAVVSPTQLTLNGTAAVTSCFHSPYIAITGTLTAQAGSATWTSGATLSLAPDAGTSSGVGTFALPAGIPVPFTVDYSDTVGGSAIGLISRCGGGEFTFRVSGAVIEE